MGHSLPGTSGFGARWGCSRSHLRIGSHLQCLHVQSFLDSISLQSSLRQPLSLRYRRFALPQGGQPVVYRNICYGGLFDWSLLPCPGYQRSCVCFPRAIIMIVVTIFTVLY
ncbi:unnamed protein product [Tuber aestivum]|uniref:Uncharacterized protein n=1 Tax=Tuber aestivum TaxID=59557 RepID=A0A292PHU4_9PEZI|nr:unnamed protein product [Tuber aestivum]